MQVLQSNNTVIEIEPVSSAKKSIRFFLENAEDLGIDLFLTDVDGKTGFDYIPEEWKSEFSLDFPQYF